MAFNGLDRNEMKSNIHKYALIVVQSPKNKSFCFHYLKMSRLYLHREWVSLHGGHCVSKPCFYGSPEQTNMALVRAFHIFLFSG